jgi:hypothetical protein
MSAPTASSVTPTTRGLYVGATGNIAVRMADRSPTTPGGSGSTVTFASVPAGSILPIQVDQVLLTGTTASSILALY